MIDALYHLTRPVLFRQDPEVVHDRVIRALGRVSTSDQVLGLLQRCREPFDPRLQVTIERMTLPGPVGIAAGLDKNAVAYPALGRLGWDYVEIGTVTPLPQSGNVKPRVFRLRDDAALINRMGFPGLGVDTVAMNIVMRRKRGVPIGINIGPNKTSVEAGLAAVIADCTLLTRRMASLADYLVLNISSPNTPNLRTLQEPGVLRELVTAIKGAMPERETVPFLIKIAPDLDPSEISAIVGVVQETGVSGVIATNTTVARPPSLRSRRRDQIGGLSGPPLLPKSLGVIRQIAQRTEGTLPIIGAGGIASGADAIAAIRAGAWAVQIYTGLIYQGPGLATRIHRELVAELERTGLTGIADLRGRGPAK
ncbi:MAG TPA: quinone-dependent dihydroorotate dehydrogenase [Thermomicrobiales bacterium]|nr:quinone-dependent dihydroorotate dehydrogenase [Thermomicrobiales bacterium]